MKHHPTVRGVVIFMLAVGTAGLDAQSNGTRPAGTTAVRKATTTRPSAGITNDDVIKMVKAGLADSAIIASIQTAPVRSFDLSPDGLLALKTANASDAVIAAILPAHPPVSSPGSPAADAAVSVSSAATVTAPAPGLYLRGSAEDDLVPLEPTVFTQGKSGGLLTSAITYGIKKAKWKAIVKGPRAQFRVEARPTFYFYFERPGSGLGNTGGFAGWLAGATSPNEFVLVKMTSKDRERELIVGEFGLFGSSAGTRSKDTVDMKIERVRPGVYRVTTAPLEPGVEYCFFYAGGTMVAGAMGKLFDFGVDGPSGTR